MLLAALAALKTSCTTAAEIGELTHPDGVLAQQGPLRHGLQHGRWNFWHADGTPAASGDYCDDLRTGTWTHYHSNGNLQMRGSYAGNRQQGLWEYWHPDASPQCRGDFVDGRELGEWRLWAAGGKLLQQGCFHAGQRQLTWTEWDDHGDLSARGPYHNDLPAGPWQRRDPTGAWLQCHYPLPPGLEYTQESWPDGGLRREGWLLHGQPDGIWATRHGNGSPRAMAKMTAGRIDGEVYLFDGAGELLAHGPVDHESGQPPFPTGVWQLRGPDGWHTEPVALPPRLPWDRRWSDAEVLAQLPLWQVAGRWLAELSSPQEPTAVVAEQLPQGLAATGPTSPRPEAPTDPGQWTLRERRELPLYRRYFRDGWLPRAGNSMRRYGGGTEPGRLGRGDSALADKTLGAALPLTRFATGDGGELDLADLRGKRVLFVVLRGFTTQVCVYCYTQTTELAAAAAEFAATDTEIVVMFPGTKGRLAAFRSACREEFGDTAPPFPMVYDQDLTLAKLLGLRGDLARPATFILDREGVVRFAYIAESSTNIADRPNTAELLRAIRRL